ncbi:chemotaxis-specific protein-glutamate methyltransferase CheB [Paracoccus sp. SCSIO 75233]|uniref:chemotaxis-specific protein-glutamate methyltransferase CheB n=1 Tax=Paracoccus sp. SCSIO 75233 TaxID=3017782 RepID=UPI0022F0D5A4|nr:chemotaxis-specific protein-glutamate methyltransferase CheB [Paracoccus sp. SCSIO 75233]WBU54345.1 chemotaxis-specific protein-glutamate methyltransferase CheB [Paracoccus sp. SCSIO 75233]
MKPVRVLIIDDSQTMRRLIRQRLALEARIEIVGEAANASEAAEAIERLSPDVLTLDVEMPGQSGLAFLRDLMQRRPMPVIMVSSETRSGSAAAVEALSAGAIECFGKPRPGDAAAAFAELPPLVLAAAKSNFRATLPQKADQPPPDAPPFRWNRKIVLIGASTGGIDALERVIATMPENCPPMLVVQHMSGGFIDSFAKRMNERYAPEIRVAANREPLAQGRILFAPDRDLHVTLTAGSPASCRFNDLPRVKSHRPSVDMMFNSATPMARRVVAALLTGMGEDGAAGMLALRRAGAVCLAQDRASSVIWGMPRMAWENGGAERLVPLAGIGPVLLAETGRAASGGVAV